jgi:hypothetical protein
MRYANQADCQFSKKKLFKRKTPLGAKRKATLSFLSGGMTQMSTVYRGVVPGVAGGTMEDQLTLSQTGGTDYSHHITTGTPGFSDLPTVLV